MTTETLPFYRSYLKQELASRVARNPRYSIRAMAYALSIEPSAFAQILAGKRVPSVKVANRLLEKLNLSPEEQKRFWISLAQSHQNRTLRRRNPFLREFVRKESESVGSALPQAKELTLDAFRVIADWYHYAILELTFLKLFKPDPNWIASQLGITPTEAKLAIERLSELGLLDCSGKRWKKTELRFTSPDKSLTAPALRRRQRQILEKSIASLEDDPIDVRNHSAMTMAIDSSKLTEAKTRIRRMMYELSSCLEEGERDRVYELSVSLFPLQKISRNEEGKKK